MQILFIIYCKMLSNSILKFHRAAIYLFSQSSFISKAADFSPKPSSWSFLDELFRSLNLLYFRSSGGNRTPFGNSRGSTRHLVYWIIADIVQPTLYWFLKRFLGVRVIYLLTNERKSFPMTVDKRPRVPRYIYEIE